MATSRNRRLSRARVLDAALALADESGVDALSMRGLAARLGVEAMSLYNHVTSKADLLDGIASRVFETIVLPEAGLPWDERARVLIKGSYAAFRAHPVVVRALVAEQADPRSIGALGFIDAVLGALFDGGLDEGDAVRGYRSLLRLVLGTVMVESVEPAGAEADRDLPVARWFLLTVTPDNLPSLYRALPALGSADCAADFDRELDLLIRGLKATARRRRPS